jgi:hypothetical protein
MVAQEVGSGQVLPVKILFKLAEQQMIKKGESLSPLLLILSDIKAAMAELKPLDFLPIIVWSLWIGSLMAGLKRIDLRDDVTQLSYVGVISALGLILTVGVPTALGRPYSMRGALILFACFVLAARLRWMLAASEPSRAAVGKLKAAGKK